MSKNRFPQNQWVENQSSWKSVGAAGPTAPTLTRGLVQIIQVQSHHRCNNCQGVGAYGAVDLVISSILSSKLWFIRRWQHVESLILFYRKATFHTKFFQDNEEDYFFFKRIRNKFKERVYKAQNSVLAILPKNNQRFWKIYGQPGVAQGAKNWGCTAE